MVLGKHDELGGSAGPGLERGGQRRVNLHCRAIARHDQVNEIRIVNFGDLSTIYDFTFTVVLERNAAPSDAYLAVPAGGTRR